MLLVFQCMHCLLHGVSLKSVMQSTSVPTATNNLRPRNVRGALLVSSARPQHQDPLQGTAIARQKETAAPHILRRSARAERDRGRRPETAGATRTQTRRRGHGFRSTAGGDMGARLFEMRPDRRQPGARRRRSGRTGGANDGLAGGWRGCLARARPSWRRGVVSTLFPISCNPLQHFLQPVANVLPPGYTPIFGGRYT